MYKYFKAKEKLRKIFNYFSIFTIIFGTTFGSLNSAYADAETVVINGVALDAAALMTDGAGGTQAINNITLTDDEAIALTGAATIATITNAATGDDTLDISGAFTLTVTGDITVIDDATLAVTLDSTGLLDLQGNVTETDEAASFVLEGSTLTLSGTSAQNIDAIIDSDSGDDGILAMTAGGKKTFDDIIGGTAELGTVTLASGVEAEFNAAADIKVVTNTGTMTFDAALGVNTLTNNGTLNINAATTNVAANDEASIVMNTAASILNFTDTGNENQDVEITATVDGYGTINIYDGTDDAAAATTTLAAGSFIGTTDKKIGTLNVGSSTKGGNLTTVATTGLINADAVNITGGNHADEDSKIIAIENINSTAITLSAAGAGDAVLNTATAAVIVTGTVDGGSTNGAGKTLIDADIATDFNDNIGATNAIEELNIAAIQVDMDGATNAITSTVFSGDGTLELDASAAQSLTSTITTTNELGTIINANTSGVLTFTGTIGTETARLKEITLNDNTDTTFANAIYALDLDIDTAAADDVTTFTVGNVIGDDGALGGALNVVGGTFVLDTAVINGTTVFDTKEVTATDAGVELRALVIQPSASFTSGTVTFIDGATAASIDAADVSALSVTDTALTDFTVNATAGVADITITATAKSSATTASEMSVTTNVGASLQQAVASSTSGSDTTAINAFNDNITSINGGSLAVASELGKQIAPQDDMISGSTVATRAITGTVQGIMSSRMASLRSGDAYFGAGMSAGSMMSANSGFIQAFGSEAEQKNKTVGSGTQYGYDSQSSGVAIGLDGINDNGVVVGLSLSMSETDVDGKGTGKAKNDIDSYTASLYMDKATDNGYIEGSLTVGLNENNSSRLVNTAGLSRTYKGSYDSQQVSLKIGGGVPNSVGNNGYVTPFGSITGTIIETDAYTETSTTSSDSLRLRVAQDDVSSVVGTVGVKYHNVMSNGGIPMISLAINNEFGDDTINSSNTYQGGGTSFTTSTAVEELSATLGLGFSMGNDVSSVEFAYEANVNDDDYLGHYGSFKIVTKF